SLTMTLDCRDDRGDVFAVGLLNRRRTVIHHHSMFDVGQKPDGGGAQVDFKKIMPLRATLLLDKASCHPVWYDAGPAGVLGMHIPDCKWRAQRQLATICPALVRLCCIKKARVHIGQERRYVVFHPTVADIADVPITSRAGQKDRTGARRAA